MMEDLEKRIANLEFAFVALHALTADLLPPSYADDAERMMKDFFDGTESLGGFKNPTFHKKD
jgi:hypothetical protein